MSVQGWELYGKLTTGILECAEESVVNPPGLTEEEEVLGSKIAEVAPAAALSGVRWGLIGHGVAAAHAHALADASAFSLL